jgi:hypothetical protein
MMNHNRRWLLAIFCAAALQYTEAEQPLRALSQAIAPAPSLNIRGTVADEEGAPLVGVQIWVHKGDKDGLSIETGSDGYVANPNVATTAGGKFSVEVKRSFLPKNGEVALSCYTTRFSA